MFLAKRDDKLLDVQPSTTHPGATKWCDKLTYYNKNSLLLEQLKFFLQQMRRSTATLKCSFCNISHTTSEHRHPALELLAAWPLLQCEHHKELSFAAAPPIAFSASTRSLSTFIWEGKGRNLRPRHVNSIRRQSANHGQLLFPPLMPLSALELQLG